MGGAGCCMCQGESDGSQENLETTEQFGDHDARSISSVSLLSQKTGGAGCPSGEPHGGKMCKAIPTCSMWSITIGYG